MTPEILRVFRPRLPPATEVAAYLARADEDRHYTNRGTLVLELEARLARLFGVNRHGVRTASSGTAALEVAILAHAGRAEERRLALMPSFTFAATAIAAERCGYIPHFVDISPETWALDPDALLHHPRIEEAGLILSVAPFGRLPDVAALERLQAAARVPVVLDAAAGFGALADGRAQVSGAVPICLSCHATKGFSTGEGGAVLWDNAPGQARVEQAANFGFLGSRQAQMAGTNAKLSKYHAAVGLAMLDGRTERQRANAAVTAAYREAAGAAELPGCLHLAPDISPAYALFEAPSPAVAARLQARLTGALVETRAWYEAGLAVQPWFQRYGADRLPVTDSLAPRLFGLPIAHDLPEEKIGLVLDLIAERGAERGYA
ncbi:DegT/DnrJ/EryC1/StrS family aminotransferase [Pseudoroseicyclus tamaricis]|uniref:Cytochrome c domain-containing protein n=1 Tax=Pseudoroseicyclus tamaricis TaxID=2705421 RepID=A0A6B2JWW3_9RHOB|nr:DegT/DnrJ/EryC1/StrS family aminotransferase [Pseudoroseicyclus tamaricis]NDV02620.1 hypothetical protein [Pseudoroseicyclus tamaricis]